MGGGAQDVKHPTSKPALEKAEARPNQAVPFELQENHESAEHYIPHLPDLHERIGPIGNVENVENCRDDDGCTTAEVDEPAQALSEVKAVGRVVHAHVHLLR